MEESTNQNNYPTVGSAAMDMNSKPAEKKDKRDFFKSIFKILFVVLLAAIAFWAGWLAQQQLAVQEDEILNHTPEATKNTTEDDTSADQLPGSTDNVDDTLDADYLGTTSTALKGDFEWTEETEEGLTDIQKSFYTCSTDITDVMDLSELNSSIYKITLSDLDSFDQAVGSINSYLTLNGFALCDDFSTDTMTEQIYYLGGRYIYLSYGTTDAGVKKLYVELPY